MKEKTKNVLKSKKGITLIALVVTIVVILILAVVSIAMLGGENGIITQAQKAKNKTDEATKNEQTDLDMQNQLIENIINSEMSDKVKITISKTPETEISGGVVLKVEKVEGIEGNIDLSDLDISQLDEIEKKRSDKENIFIFIY